MMLHFLHGSVKKLLKGAKHFASTDNYAFRKAQSTTKVSGLSTLLLPLNKQANKNHSQPHNTVILIVILNRYTVEDADKDTPGETALVVHGQLPSDSKTSTLQLTGNNMLVLPNGMVFSE